MERNVKFVIRKVPERNTEYLERLIPDHIIYCDEAHEGTRASFEKAIIFAYSDAIYIQDDMILCKNFIEKTLEYINRYPDKVIVFANCCESDKYSVFEEGFYEADKGGWLMCTYIPKRIALDFLVKKNENAFKKPPTVKRFDLDDVEFCCYLNSIREDVFVVVPNLAGHPKNESVTGFKRKPRICPNFDYENAEV